MQHILWIIFEISIFLKIYIVLYILLTTKIGNAWSGIFQNIMRHRDNLNQIQQLWDNMLCSQKFSIQKFYTILVEDDIKVPWRFLMKNNLVRPQTLITLWMLCHGRLPTKDRLIKFGLLQDSTCTLCTFDRLKLNIMFSLNA